MKLPRISSRLVKIIWMANLGLGLILGLAAGSLWLNNASGHPVFASAPEHTPTPLIQWTPGPFFRPSATPASHNTVEDTNTSGPYGPYIIGTSFSGRPIVVYRFGTGARERLIVAGIHGGNEWNTVVLAYQLIDYLSANPDTVPADKTLYILPLLNPDGAARAHDRTGRVNDRGVDLNRNWPYRWAAEWDREGCWNYLPTSAGEYAGSEPETQTLMAFIEKHNFDALISYHSAALGIFAGGVPTLPESDRLARALEKVSPYSYPPMDTGCNYTGNLADWASSVHGIAAVDIELRNHRDSDFEENLRVLKTFLNWEP
jgi:predicted deacylase